MDGASWADAFATSAAAREAYVASLPVWVRLWMNWMGGVLAISLAFAWWKVEARIVLAMLVLLLPLTQLWGFLVGWNRLWGLTHVVLWTPLVVYLARRFQRGRVRLTSGSAVDRVYTGWLLVAGLTMLISLLFDYADVARYLLGDRS